MKRIALIFLAFLALAALAQTGMRQPKFVAGLNPSESSTPSTLLTGLVAFYMLDEASGNSRADSAGSYTLLERSAVLRTNGVANYAMWNENGNNSLTNTYGTELNPTNFTLSFWYYSPSNGTRYILVNGTNTAAPNFNYFITCADNSITMNVLTNGAAQGTRQSSWTMPTTNILTHYCFLYDDSTYRCDLYTNAVKSATKTAGQAPKMSGGTFYQFYLGASHLGSSRANGLIDEFALHNRLLTTNEILNLYRAGTNGVTYPFTGF